MVDALANSQTVNTFIGCKSDEELKKAESLSAQGKTVGWAKVRSNVLIVLIVSLNGHAMLCRILRLEKATIPATCRGAACRALFWHKRDELQNTGTYFLQ